MTKCRPEDSAHFLSGTLSDAEEASFIEHLDACETCQQRLRQAAGSEEDWQSTKNYLLCCCEAHEPGVSAASERGDREVREESIVRGLLAPSDFPESIGRVGPYEIVGLLGRGGAGIVLKGFDRSLNRCVAVKVLDPALAGTGAARQRFAREARAMAAISHEHVVPVFGVDEHRGLPYFTMEYVAGGSLESRLQRDGQCDVVSVVRVGLQIAEALTAAHGHGLVHRDVKPGNILLDRGTERVRVADFGLARVATETAATRSGVVAGTPQYMSPEQVRGENCDAQSDLFSLGSVMYAMCTGHSPFRADSVYAVMQRIVHDRPRPIREQSAAVPPWLEALVFKLLSKEKSGRFASAEEVASTLCRELAWLENPTGTPPQRTWMTPSLSRGRRSRTWASVIGVSVVGALLAGYFSQGFVRSGPENQPRSGSSESTRGAAGASSSGSRAIAAPDDAELTALRSAIDELERRSHDLPAAGGASQWQKTIHELEAGLIHLEQEQTILTEE